MKDEISVKLKWVSVLIVISLIFIFGTSGVTQAQDIKDQYLVGYSRWNMGDVFFNSVQYGIEQEIKRIEEEYDTDIRLLVKGANSGAKQISFLRAFQTRGADGIIISMWEPEAVYGPIKDMYKEGEGIPFVTDHGCVPDTDIPYVSIGDYKSGKKSAEHAIEKLEALHGEDWIQEGGIIVIYRCAPQLLPDQLRTKGARSVIDPIVEEHPDKWKIEERVCHCSPDEGLETTQDLLTSYGDEIKLIWSVDATTVYGGTVPALEQFDMNYPQDDPRHIVVAVGAGNEYGGLKAIRTTEAIDAQGLQAGIADGEMLMRTLWTEITQGKDALPQPGATIEGDGPGYPVVAYEGQKYIDKYLDGQFDYQGVVYETDAPLIGVEISPKNKGIGGNVLYYNKHGEWPWEAETEQ